MKPRNIPFIWNAEIVVSRGPVDDPLFVNVICSSVMTDSVGSYGQQLLEENAMNYLAEQLDEPVEAMSLISLHWSMLDDEQTHDPATAPE